MSATNTSSAPSGTSYTMKALSVAITLGEGTFGATGQNTVTLSNLRMVVTISKAGMPSMDSADIRVYGVDPTIMNTISTLGINPDQQRQKNTVTVLASSITGGMVAIYTGAILNAWQSFDEIPETSLNIIGLGANTYALQPATPTSVSGTADVATLMAGFASTLGIAFENNGVNVKVSCPYLPGTTLDAIYSLARAANIQAYIDSGGATPTLAIWPQNLTRTGPIPLINKASGLIGYPKFRDKAMAFRCLFNPNIRLNGQIEMQSSVGSLATPAQSNATATSGGPNGIWLVRGPLTYSLSSQLPGGPWFCDVVCARTAGPVLS